MIRDHKMVAEERFPMSEQGYTSRKVIRQYRMSDTIAHWRQVNHSCLNPITYTVNHSTHYLNLHQKHREFKQAMDSMQVYFCHSIIIDIHSHRFKIYILVSKIHENIDIVLRIKCIKIRKCNKFMRVLFYVS